MNSRAIALSGQNYASRRNHDYFEEFKIAFDSFNGSNDDFFLDCMDKLLSKYSPENPPCFSLFTGPITSLNRVLGEDIRQSMVYKNFSRGYKQKLESLGKTTNYASPVFLDHYLSIVKSMLQMIKGCSSKVFYEQFRFVLLMKLWYGVRTGDMCKVRYEQIRVIDKSCYSVGSDGRKGCSAVESPTVFYVYKFKGERIFCLHDCVTNLRTSGCEGFVFSETNRRK